MDVLVEIGQRKFERGDATARNTREAFLLFRFEIIEGDAGEVGNDDVARSIVHAPVSGEVLDIFEGLRLSLSEVLAEALVFNEQDAGPEKIDKTVLTGNFPDRFFKARDNATADTEDVEEFVPEGLLFGAFAFDAGPFLRKGNRTMADFVPGKRHRRMIAKGCQLVAVPFLAGRSPQLYQREV